MIQLAQAASNRRSLVVRVERSAAEAGKMLAASNDSMRCQAEQEMPPILNNALNCGRRGARTHHLRGRRQGEVEYGGERIVKAELPARRLRLTRRAHESRICFLIEQRHARHEKQLVPMEMEQAHRAGGRPTRPLHRRSEDYVVRTMTVASFSRARVCAALSILRRKRMIPAGRTSLSHARSRPVSSVAPRPTTSKLPAA